MVGYHYNVSYIQGIPIKNRKGQIITKAYEELHNIFAKTGAAP